jgi:hypothetical protein
MSQEIWRLRKFTSKEELIKAREEYIMNDYQIKSSSSTDLYLIKRKKKNYFLWFIFLNVLGLIICACRKGQIQDRVHLKYIGPKQVTTTISNTTNKTINNN